MQQEKSQGNKKDLSLSEYFDKFGIKKTTFANRLGISYAYLNKIVNGRDMYISIADKIVAMTEGRISIESLIRGLETKVKEKKTGCRRNLKKDHPDKT